MNNRKTISELYINLIEIERNSEEKDLSLKAKELIEELIHRGYYSVLCQGIVHIRTIFDRNDLLSIGKTNYSIKNPELIEKLCYKEFVRIKETIKNRFEQINFQKLNNSLFVSFQRGFKKLVGLSLVYKSLLNRTDTQQKIKKKLVLISKKIHKYQIATQCYLWLQSSKITFKSPKNFKISFLTIKRAIKKMKIENEILSNFELNCEIELIQGLWHLDHEQYSIGVTYLICKGKKLGFENKILELLVENKRYEEVLLMMNSIDIEIETIDDVLCIQKCYLHCGLYYESFCFSRNCLVNHEKIHRLNLQESKAKSTIFNPLFNFFISNKKVNLLFQLPFNQDEENLLEQYLETLKNKNTGYNFLFVWYLQKQKISQAFQINDKLNNIEKINGKINLTRNNLINIHHNWFPSTKDNSSIFLKNSFDLSTTSNSQSITDNKIISETSLLSTTKFMSKIKSKNKQSLKKSKFETPMFQTGNENEKKNKNEIEIESERNRTNFFVSNFSNLKNPNISTNHNFQSQPPTSQNTKNIPEINIQSYRKSFGTSFTKLFSNTNFDNDDDQNSTTRKKLNFQKYKKITQTPNKQEQQEQTSSFFSNLDNSFENKLNTDLEIEIEKEKENENESETESESESENNEFFLNQNSGSESESDLEQQSFDLQNSEQASMSLQKKNKINFTWTQNHLTTK